MGRSPLNVHCHLVVKLSERASFNKFNKNFKIWHFQHENILDKLEILGNWGGQHSIIQATELSEVAHLRHFEINPAGSFISWCKNPQIVNHLQMLRILGALSPAQPSSVQQLQISASDYILSLIYFACWSGGPTYLPPPHPTPSAMVSPPSSLSQTASPLVDPLSVCPTIFPSSPVIFRRKVNLKISFRVLNLKLRKFSPEF